MAETIAIDYQFNVKPALDNVKKLGNSFTELEDKQKKVEKSSAPAKGMAPTPAAKSPGGGAGAVAGGMVVFSAISKVFDKLMSAMPFVTQMFDQIGTVIINNLVHPLSKFLLPILMDMMRWVRENRTAFVQLGGVIASIFKAGFSIAMNLFKVLKQVLSALFDTVLGKGKATFGSFIDFLNLALLKIVFMITFVSILIEPVLVGIGKLLGWLLNNAVIPFAKGFMEEFASIFEYIGPLFEGLNQLMDALGESEGLSGIAEVFSFLGKAVAGSLITPLKLLLSISTFIIKATASFIKNFKDGGKFLSEMGAIFSEFADNVIKTLSGGKIIGGFTNFVNAAKSKFMELKTWIGSLIDSIVGWFTGIGTAISDGIQSGITGAKQFINDSFVGKIYNKVSGENIFDSPSPATTPTGTAGTASNTSNTNNNQKVDIKIDGAKSPEATAQAVKKAMEENSMKNRYNKAAASQGIQ